MTHIEAITTTEKHPIKYIAFARAILTSYCDDVNVVCLKLLENAEGISWNVGI